MSNLFAARAQTGMSLGFHIVFACIGIGLPLLMVTAEFLWLRTREEIYLTLAKRWAKGTAILFAIGAVSGTVISFQLGLLWPSFMRYAGPIIGMPFSLEGLAFFTEAIFIGIYLYGWNRVKPWAHWWTGVAVAFSGVLSGIFVVSANSWMNSYKAGFDLDAQGHAINVDPIAAMFNPGWKFQALHMTLAAYMATGMAVAGIHAFMLLRNRGSLFHRRAMTIGLVWGGLASVLQPLSGDLNAQYAAHNQPEKLAAIEGQFKTEAGAPLRIGGIPDPVTKTTHYAIEIPCGLSLLAFHDPHATVKGLDDFPADQRPDPVVVHIAFEIMVAAGMTMMLVAIVCGVYAWRRRRAPDHPWLLRALVFCTPLGFIAVEAGWTVTEVGRQPWIVYKVLRVSETVTPMPRLEVPLFTFMILYLFLSWVVATMIRRQVVYSEEGEAQHAQP